MTKTKLDAGAEMPKGHVCTCDDEGPDWPEVPPHGGLTVDQLRDLAEPQWYRALEETLCEPRLPAAFEAFDAFEAALIAEHGPISERLRKMLGRVADRFGDDSWARWQHAFAGGLLCGAVLQRGSDDRSLRPNDALPVELVTAVAAREAQRVERDAEERAAELAASDAEDDGREVTGPMLTAEESLEVELVGMEARIAALRARLAAAKKLRP